MFELELVLDQKYDLYYSVPDGTEIGALRFYIDAPAIAGSLVTPIAQLLIPQALASQNVEATRLKIWQNPSQIPFFTRFTVEASFHAPQAALEPLTITAIAIAVGTFIAAHGTAILAVIGIAIAGFFAVTYKYGPINPVTGERESPKGGIEWILIALAILVGITAVAYVYATKGELPLQREEAEVFA